MQARTLIFIVNYVLLLGMITLGYDSLKLGFPGTVVSYVAAALAVVLLAVAVVLHSRLPKKHTRATDFPHLVTTGPYGYVRHPFYSAVIALNYAVSLAFLSYFAVIASTLMLPLWWYLVKTEERDLVDAWGQEYLDYRKRVPMFFPKFWTKDKREK
jgi:protein-S-isoprenylcysteine O-methyltransferase Ste14